MLKYYVLPIVVTLTVLVGSAATEPQRAASQLSSVRIDGVPHVRQKPDFCGEACVAMMLGKLGQPADQDYVFDRSGLDPVLGRGCYTKELKQAAQQVGFDVGPVWYAVEPDRAAPQVDERFRQLHGDLEAGVPSIVCTRFDEREGASEHFRLIVGYDAEQDTVLYHDPAIDRGAYLQMPRKRLLSIWPLKYRDDRWTLVRLRLKPDRIEDVRPSTDNTAADYAQHVLRLKRKLPSEDFHIVLQPPFVVVGNEPAAAVQQRAERTVKWAVDRLKKDYFAQDPHHVIDIWLFKDKASYESGAWQLFRDRPGTPFGYYSPVHRALVMNISTGGGTLVHEIVHPFMASNFRRCPAWFNEGLASLYEQCADNDGHIWGRTNWRLRGLQGAIRGGSVPSFESLCTTTSDEFYHDDRGTNYAQARYLCYYLQEQGKLVEYYHAFRENADDDPSGYVTLQQVLEVEDMEAFQQQWETYVLKLRFL